jgi:1,4-dihydroxy-6-naphthoate synthase
MKEITLAYSPCPNDTFIFYHLIHSSLSNELHIKEELYDVELLNQFAQQAKFDSTKLSFFAYFQVMEKYILLNSGSALGRGCGPMIIKKNSKKVSSLEKSNLAIPGLHTTANLLLNLFFHDSYKSKPTVSPIRYDTIIPALINEQYDYGLIIHEERFTYQDHGLEKVIDLGEWWEALTGKLIPLGAIAVRRSLEEPFQKKLDQLIRKSIELSFQDSTASKSYIKRHSQSLEDKVIEQHIQLYVNQYSIDLGTEGKNAIYTLYEKALDADLCDSNTKPVNLIL